MDLIQFFLILSYIYIKNIEKLFTTDLSGGLPKPVESLEAVGNGSRGAIKVGSNGAGPGSDVKGGGTVGDIVQQRHLGGDRGDSQYSGGVPPPGTVTEYGDGGEMRGRQRVGVPLGIEFNGICGAPTHWGVHQ